MKTRTLGIPQFLTLIINTERYPTGELKTLEWKWEMGPAFVVFLVVFCLSVAYFIQIP